MYPRINPSSRSLSQPARPWTLQLPLWYLLCHCRQSLLCSSSGRQRILSLLHLWNKGEVQVESQLRQVPHVTPTALCLHWVPTLPRWLLRMGSRTGNTLYHTPLLPSPLLWGSLLAPGWRWTLFQELHHPRTSIVLSPSGTSDVTTPTVERIQAFSPGSPSDPMWVTGYLDLTPDVRHISVWVQPSQNVL